MLLSHVGTKSIPDVIIDFVRLKNDIVKYFATKRLG